MMTAACAVLFDGIRRMYRTKIENSAICIKMAFLLSTAFLAQLVSDIVLQSASNKSDLEAVYTIGLVSFTIAFGILAFILFMIGVQSANSVPSGKTEFERLASEELITEDWET